MKIIIVVGRFSQKSKSGAKKVFFSSRAFDSGAFDSRAFDSGGFD
jgi:hypothetical protein